MTSIKQYAVEYATRVNPATERILHAMNTHGFGETIGYQLTNQEQVGLIEAMIRRHNGVVYQGLMNNLWDNNPGELDRWADDGGQVP